MTICKGDTLKILSITGNRADYDLMSYLYGKLNMDKDVDLKLIVTGAHLTLGYEESYENIINDGNNILVSVENILNSDSKKSRAKSTSILLSSIIDPIDSFKPDIIMAAGDREEVIVLSIVAAYMGVPFVHFFGGDFAKSGHVDNLVRNAASKMGTVHMVATEEHKKRLIMMGEDEQRIYVIGSVALDKFREEPFISREDLFKRLRKPVVDEYALLIYHPPSEIVGANREIKNIMEALNDANINTFVSYPNTDFNNSSIRKVFENYSANNNFHFYNNLDRNTFINLYRNSKFQIGNSSSGICESASIPIPVIDVGSRQDSRSAQENVIHISGDYDSIADAIKTVSKNAFSERIQNIKNQYGDGFSSERAYTLIKQIDFSKILLKTNDPIER